ncbi:MAG: hypothetical protein KJO05_09580 [Bacteroidia bacterium]|nr:hypothetical protein [Bacteroidia bacterium]NNF30143.1 hypothetical protein [Flavobacteriaceae bacterium]MBT8275021.1 hypothetical protein [Bacteroidia bacterium]NNJ81797.1 hypothetical protein [Flavobacteriaceae bacterium]NNK55493.1 hypothetical protein [Flavobacteriaceae bacterium]
MNYKKSQTGWIVIGIMVPILVLLYLSYVHQWGDNPLPLLPFAIIAIVLIIAAALFYQLTVEVDRTTVKVIYGIGLIRIKFKIDELLSTHVIRTPWYYGYGIRITPKGMLYNIQGSKAVEIKFISKGKHKSVMIGSPEPEKLQRAIDHNFRKRAWT